MRRLLAPLTPLVVLLAVATTTHATPYVGAASFTSVPVEVPAEVPPEVTAEADQPACRPASECCKMCRKGQACGDSCISRKYTCHKGRGCACNAAEVCR